MATPSCQTSNNTNDGKIEKSPGNGQRGRGSSGGGRGRGSPGKSPWHRRGRGGNQTPQKTPERDGQSWATPSPRSMKTLRVETTDFQSVHAQCGASKYKVHRPRCSCPKMKGLLGRPITETDDLSLLMGGLNVSPKNDDSINEAIETNSENESKSLPPTPNNHNNHQRNVFDALTIIPDTNGSQFPVIYSCLQTDKTCYTSNPRECERKLQREIFGGQEVTDKIEDIRSFKISCASCLLDNDPNGFVCLGSSSAAGLNVVIHEANDTANRKRNKPGGLHPDHAHFVCAIEVKSLHEFRSKRTTGSKQCIISQLQEGGVNVDCMTNGILTNNEAKVELGHHLSTMLRLIGKRKDDKLLSTITHWMVIGYTDGPDFWSLDLPGGKRHLGESTLQCARRETEEECSVEIDAIRLLDEKRTKKIHDGECNLFYVVPV